VRQSVGDGAPRLIRSAQAEHQQQVLVRRLDLDPALIAIAVIANRGEFHASGPEVQRRLLVLYRNDDLPHPLIMVCLNS
jgi:hypothetical protein